MTTREVLADACLQREAVHLIVGLHVAMRIAQQERFFLRTSHLREEAQADAPAIGSLFQIGPAATRAKMRLELHP